MEFVQFTLACLGGGYKYFVIFTPNPEEDFKFDSYFFKWVETTNQKLYPYMDVSENRGTSKWKVYNGKPY